ncbi:MAG: hypothetical protein R2736_16675 [Solirubrobacterales bacterium]
MLFEIVRRNREWWGGNGSLLGYGARAKFTGSRVVSYRAWACNRSGWARSAAPTRWPSRGA